MWDVRFENVGSVLGGHLGRGYTGCRRSPTLMDALPSGHPFSRLVRHAGEWWVYSIPRLQGECLRLDIHSNLNVIAVDVDMKKKIG